MPKIKLEFDGFNDVIQKLEKLDGDVRKTTEKALKETHKIITSKAEAAIIPHRRTGRTQKSLVRKADVEWNGTTASVYVGFDFEKGGLPHIFLMWGTPRMKKDPKFYAAFYSDRTYQEVQAAQEKIFFDEIARLG
jgi:HK97 gp10 family phage protein